MRLNKKGFTLVELLAVIVILAVVMLIAVTAVGPLMAKARKNALGTEGIGMVNAAKTAYQAEQLSGKIKSTETVCFTLNWLCNMNYFEKGCSANGVMQDSYTGSVLVSHDSTTGKNTYTYWISNGTYVFGNGYDNGTNGKGVDPAKFDVENSSVVREGKSADIYCGLAKSSAKSGAAIGAKRFGVTNNKSKGTTSNWYLASQSS